MAALLTRVYERCNGRTSVGIGGIGNESRWRTRAYGGRNRSFNFIGRDRDRTGQTAVCTTATSGERYGAIIRDRRAHFDRNRDRLLSRWLRWVERDFERRHVVLRDGITVSVRVGEREDHASDHRCDSNEFSHRWQCPTLPYNVLVSLSFSRT